FSGGAVDYQFYFNLNITDIIFGLGIFFWQTLLCIAVFTALLFFLVILSGWTRRKLSALAHIGIIVVSAGLFALLGGPTSRLYEIYQVVTAPKKPFNEALEALGFNYEQYPHAETLTAEKGKNIVVISLESLEQGFLTDAFPGLMPNM